MKNVELVNRINGFLSWNFFVYSGRNLALPFCIFFFFFYRREGLLRKEFCVHAYDKYSLQSVTANLAESLEKLILEQVNILVLGILSWVPFK